MLLAGRYTLLDRSADDELLPLCAERGVPVLAAGVFNSGVLAGGSTFDYEAAPDEILERRRALETMCARYDVPLAAAAIQFPLRHPAVASVVVGARSPDEIEEDVRLLDVPSPTSSGPRSTRLRHLEPVGRDRRLAEDARIVADEREAVAVSAGEQRHRPVGAPHATLRPEQVSAERPCRRARPP